MINTDIFICENELSEKVSQYLDSIKKVCSAAIKKEGFSGTLNISFVEEDEIKSLNSQFRNIDSVTDVLSFPANELSAPLSKTGVTCDMEIEDEMIVLGDIAICVKRAIEQAEEYGHSLERELCFLTVHGTLHLMGYDHMTSEEEKEMFSIQEEVLKMSGIER